MSFTHPTHRRSQGFTLIELLVVISIIAILAGMLLPVIGVVREMARKAQCGKNQSQILGAMVAYSTSEEVTWPDPRTTAATIATGDPAAIYTAKSFELLAASQKLPSNLFKCPSTSGAGPNKSLNPSANRALNTEAIGVCTWGWSGVNRVSYGFDWSSPADPGAARVILADRDIVNHKTEVMACFGDAHVKPLKAETTATTQQTRGAVRDPGFNVINPDAKGGFDQADDAGSLLKDSIFTWTGDAAAETECLIPGAGHAIRSYVK